jgi:hypothetical protein
MAADPTDDWLSPGAPMPAPSVDLTAPQTTGTPAADASLPAPDPDAPPAPDFDGAVSVQPTPAPVKTPAAPADDWINPGDPIKPQSGIATFFRGLTASAGEAQAAEAGTTVSPEQQAQDQQAFTDVARHTVVGRIFTAMGASVVGDFSSAKIGASPEFDNAMRQMGLYNDYAKGDASILKTFYQSLFSSAIASADIFSTAFQAGAGAAGAAVGQTAQELGVPNAQKLGQDISGAIMNEAMSPSMGHMAPHPVTLDIAAHDAKVFESEGAYMGTEPGTNEPARLAASSIVQSSSAEPPAEAAVAPEPTAPSVSDIARQIAPDTFKQYDNLTAQRDQLRGVVEGRVSDAQDEVADQFKERLEPAQQQVDDLQRQLDGFEKAGNDKKAALFRGRLDKAQSVLDGINSDLSDAQDAAAAKVRADAAAELLDIHHRLADLAPDLSAATRAADEHANGGAPLPSAEQVENSPSNNLAEAQPINLPNYENSSKPVENANNLIGSEPSNNLAGKLSNSAETVLGQDTTHTPIEQQRANIVADVTKKLDAIGRPADEALANAEMVAAHYEAKAALYNGTKGSAEDLYKAEMPDIATAEKGGPRGEANGKMVFRNARNTLTMFAKADASTFMHEMAHNWLEQMMKDAADDAAPESLKADADAVRKWIGLKEGAKITKAPHERFARGFETYLMEGRAPSQKLAGVFAQFKNWLTKIYGTVNKIGRPISDDIRGVFDRLLVHAPERTVIAPEGEVGRSFADLHETDAETTPPEKAHEAATVVRSEQNAIINHAAPEDLNAVVERTSDASGGREATGEESDRDANAAGTGTGEGGSPAEPGTVGPRGGEAAPDGGGARGEIATAERPAEAVSPATVINNGKKFENKAGNIRLDLLNTTDDIDAAIHEMSDENDGFMSERRGVVSIGQTMDLADAAGVDTAWINREELGKAYNAHQIAALTKIMIQTAKDVVEKAQSGVLADYLEARERLKMIQARVAGATAEAGRALNIFNHLRRIEGGDEATVLGQFLKDEDKGRTLFQAEDEMRKVATMQTSGQAARLVHQSATGGLKAAILEYYINALISGPITHFRYSVGNTVAALWTPLVQIPIAAGVGKLAELHAGEPIERVRLGEAGAQLYAMGRGSREGIKAAVEAWKNGFSPALPGERVSAHFADAPVRAIPGKIGEVLNYPSKSVSAIHSFFKSLRYAQNIAGAAYRMASEEGLEGDAFDQRVAELTMSPTPETMAALQEKMRLGDDLTPQEQMMRNASAEAMRELYMAPTEYNSLAGMYSRWANGPGVAPLIGKILVPFMKIGSEITHNAFMEQTPLGLLNKGIRDNALGRNGEVARDMQLARVAGGVALMGVTSTLVLEGMATGDGPSDPAKRAVWLLSHKPNSIQIGDITLPYQGLGSLGMLMRFSANTVETARGWGDEHGNKLASTFFGMSKAILDENFMRGLHDALDAIYAPDRNLERWVENFATNWLPFSVGMSQVARAIDPDQRVTDGIFEQAASKVPLLSETLQPRRDVFGQPILNGSSVAQYAHDPVVQRMNALDMGVGRLEKKIRGVALTEDQYDDFSNVAGKLAKMRLDALVQPGFEQIPAQMQINKIADVIRDSRHLARQQMIAKYPDIAAQATSAKMLKKYGAIAPEGPQSRTVEDTDATGQDAGETE